MMRQVLKSKIHRATVTEANLEYIGSITIDKNLMDAVDLWENEKVLVVDNNNGNRLETYVITGELGTGIICMNGAAAHLIKKGDEIIVMSFAITEKPIKPINILVDKENKIIKHL